jgi:hypothetical protein
VKRHCTRLWRCVGRKALASACSRHVGGLCGWRPSRADIRSVQQIKNVVRIDPCIVPLLDHRQQATQLRER